MGKIIVLVLLLILCFAFDKILDVIFEKIDKKRKEKGGN